MAKDTTFSQNEKGNIPLATDGTGFVVSGNLNTLRVAQLRTKPCVIHACTTGGQMVTVAIPALTLEVIPEGE